MNIVLTPGEATLATLEQIYRGDDSFELDRAARHDIDRAADIISVAKSADTPIYGVNTGFGKLASARIDKADMRGLERVAGKSAMAAV